MEILIGINKYHINSNNLPIVEHSLDFQVVQEADDKNDSDG